MINYKNKFLIILVVALIFSGCVDKDRIYDDDYGLDQLNNCWTLEETDVILNSIKGSWEVDEYVGYISYSLYCNGRLTEEINSEEEKVYRELIWEQFENAKIGT